MKFGIEELITFNLPNSQTNKSRESVESFDVLSEVKQPKEIDFKIADAMIEYFKRNGTN